MPQQVGDETKFFGLTTPFVPVYQKSVVTKRENLHLSDGRPPQFVESNVECYFFDHVASCTGGVFQGPDGHVAALWLCHDYQTDGSVKQVYRSVNSRSRLRKRPRLRVFRSVSSLTCGLGQGSAARSKSVV